MASRSVPRRLTIAKRTGEFAGFCVVGRVESVCCSRRGGNKMYLRSILDLAGHDYYSRHALHCVQSMYCSQGWRRVSEGRCAASLPICFSGFAIPGAGGMVGNEEAKEPPARPGDSATGRVPRAAHGGAWRLDIQSPTPAGHWCFRSFCVPRSRLFPLALPTRRLPW
jgi:hypothetical protein